jgi:hypothetical protein
MRRFQQRRLTTSDALQHSGTVDMGLLVLLVDGICWFGLFAQDCSLMKGEEPKMRRFLYVNHLTKSQQAILN